VIYKTKDGGWVISSGGSWLPGVYKTASVARWAFRFPNETLQRLQDEANKRGDSIITEDDLRNVSRPQSSK